MTDLPPDLPSLRTLETWLVLTLDRVRRQIAATERREQERRRGEKARPPIPDWILVSSLNRSSPPLAAHVGGCTLPLVLAPSSDQFDPCADCIASVCVNPVAWRDRFLSL
ncbi:hypothetical protein [Streptomyces sp. NRRL S-813]|uniref:hypothetical protein n=1 Tax=Streptomyces sp. NRRL S-813 TaxID=1463919 RepID=UPI00131E7D77|nr:hypothetical protein [Streptomyces sp. NRRL S-813]